MASFLCVALGKGSIMSYISRNPFKYNYNSFNRVSPTHLTHLTNKSYGSQKGVINFRTRRVLNWHSYAKFVKSKPKIYIGSTSHLSIFDDKHVNFMNVQYSNCSHKMLHEAKRRVNIFKEVNMPAVNLHTYKGMFLLEKQFERDCKSVEFGKKSLERLNQCNGLFNSMKESRETVCVLVVGSNDLKNFLYNPVTKELFKPRRKDLLKWEQLTVPQKCRLNLKKRRFLVDTTRKHLCGKVDEMMDVLIPVLQDCSFKTVLFSSFLERSWGAVGVPNLPFWFSHLNSMLYEKIKKLNVTNKNGELIGVRLINVAKQFYEAAENKELHKIFRNNELKTGELTHRNSESVKALVKIYMKEATDALQC